MGAAIDALIKRSQQQTSSSFSAPKLDLTSSISNRTANSTPATTTLNINPITPFLPRKEAVPFRRAFETTPIQTKAPPIVTTLAGLGNMGLEALPRLVATVGGEIAGKGQPVEVKSNVDLRRFGYDTPNYQTAAKEQQDAINKGENPWISGLGIVSNKTLDIAFGAQIVTGLARTATAKLLAGGVEARIAAQDIIETTGRKEMREAFARLKDAPLDVREKTLAELTNAKNQAEKILKEQGSPTALDRARAKIAQTTEVIGRETPISPLKTYPERLSQPDVTPKTAPLSPTYIAGNLPGYRETPGQTPAFGLSTKQVEPVGFGDSSIKPELQPIADKAKQMSLKEFNSQFERGLVAQNLTVRQTAQNVLKLIQDSGLKTPTDFYNKVTTPIKFSKEGIPLALSAREKAIVGLPSLSKPLPVDTTTGEGRSLEIAASQKLGESFRDILPPKDASLADIVSKKVTDVKDKVNIIDYVRTPDRVLTKIGLGKEAASLRVQYDKYLKELPKNIDKITAWSKRASKGNSQDIFDFLDGKAIDLKPQDKEIALEIKTWLKQWADRLGLPENERIAYYITHIFDKELLAKEFPEELAKMIANKIPGEVYDPFLQKRLGTLGYKHDVWLALDAYVKRATRKVYMDPALEKVKEASGSLEISSYNYVKHYIDNINMRPGALDTLIDNGIKQLIGYKLGQRPLLTITRFLRTTVYRAMLGLNPASALKNISQGINTYAVLGEKYTTIGYIKLFSKGAKKELEAEGVLNAGFIEDKALSSTRKVIEKFDKVLFSFFETAEHINRGAAYFGAKAKYIAEHTRNIKKGIDVIPSTLERDAIDYGKKVVRDTQFVFGKIDTPLVLSSDLGKTIGQFQSFTTKQIEFLAEMAKKAATGDEKAKNFIGLLRYAVAGTVFVYTVGKAFNMKISDIIPAYRFGVPPSLKVPYEVGSAALNAPNQYGQPRTLGQKLKDIGNTLWGIIPAGTQAKKTIQGYQAMKQGQSTDSAGRSQFDVGGTLLKDAQALLFGKYAGQDSQNYFSGMTYAEATLEKIKKSPTGKADLAKIIKNNPALANSIVQVLKKQALGITKEDDKLLNLGVANKARAKAVADQLNKLKTKEEKKALMLEYMKKKIITVDVAKQLPAFLKK